MISRKRQALCRSSIPFVMMLVLSALMVLLPAPARADSVEISLSEAIALSQSDNASKVVIDTNGGLMIITVSSQTAPVNLTDVDGNPLQVPHGAEVRTNIGNLNIAELEQIGFVLPADFDVRATENDGNNFSSILFLLLPLMLILGLFFFLMRAGRGGGGQSQASNFARSRARLASPDMPRVSFTDVAGAEEAKEDLEEVVQFLRDRRRFQAMGAIIPKGALLTGPPGTGKTLLARAVAGEAGVPFFSISGSEFVEMFVGVGAARVRDLFEQAKKQTPCIIFIDEIDAVGRQRTGGMPGGHEEREQTLNQILTEMDGFDPNIGVIVLAATNRPDILDAALLRPGRFDRRVVLDPPDTNGRKAILQVHSRNKPLGPDVDMETLAKETHGFTGADLANLMNEAAILAVRRKKTTIDMKELEDSVDRVIAGPERKSLKINPRDRETTAYHEAGHALVAHLLPNADPVLKISIVARGSMGGYTRLLTEDRYFMTYSKLRDTLATLVAGHTAEEMIFGEVSTGPHNDIKQATKLVKQMISDYGMSRKLGVRTFGAEGYAGGPQVRDYSEETARAIDQEIREMLDEARGTAKELLSRNRAMLEHLTETLLAEETLEGPALEIAFRGPISKATSHPDQDRAAQPAT